MIKQLQHTWIKIDKSISTQSWLAIEYDKFIYFSAFARLDLIRHFENFGFHVEVIVFSQLNQQHTEIGATQVQSQEFSSF